MPQKQRNRSNSATTDLVPSTSQALVTTGSNLPATIAAPAALGAVRLPDPVTNNFPELPEVLETDTVFDAEEAEDHIPIGLSAVMPGGCYLARYTPIAKFGTAPVHYDGTLRVERSGSKVISSGDLYSHKVTNWPIPTPVKEPNPSAGIPIFARKNYTYYLKATKFAETQSPLTKKVTIDLSFYKFTSGTWSAPQATVAVVKPVAPPAGFPPLAPFFSGEVKSATGTLLGTLTLCRVSKLLRKATIEIDRCAPCEWPLDNGSGIDWKAILGLAGWDVTVEQSNADVTEPSGNSWSNAEMHAAMLAKRASGANLDKEWRYHILCVRNIDATPRGIMYDSSATDSNNVPREGVGISSHWVIPNNDEWGLVKNTRFGLATGPYFRTAVHEIGHAMGLYHNAVDLGIMNTTDVIAAQALGGPVQFPNNIQWSHAPDDQSRLRHLPDIHVRPGGMPFGSPYGPDENADEATGLRVEVKPVMPSFPIGAPVRVDFELVNESDVPLHVPKSLGMKSGHVRGVITDPAGGTQPFLPMLLCVEEHELQTLQPGERTGHSLTLLRGPRGSLFSAPGGYRIAVDISWEVDGLPVTQRGETSVMITPPVSESHAAAALKVLSTPDTVVALVVGGEHLTEGIDAIHVALNDETLRPHFAAVEAKRVATRFFTRKPDLAAASHYAEDAICTVDEQKKLAKLGVTV